MDADGAGCGCQRTCAVRRAAEWVRSPRFGVMLTRVRTWKHGCKDAVRGLYGEADWNTGDRVRKH